MPSSLRGWATVLTVGGVATVVSFVGFNALVHGLLLGSAPLADEPVLAFVLVNALNAPVLGTSLAVSVVLLGQVAIGLGMDHGGWLGVPRRRVTLARVASAAVVLLGVALVRFG